jgi:hypothetical protein
MGTPVGRIEKEFVFKSLVDEGASADLHSRKKEARVVFAGIGDGRLDLKPAQGDFAGFEKGEEVRIFFYLKNNYHTFNSRILEVKPERIAIMDPNGIYKNLQRKYERVKPERDIEVWFSIKGKKVELNFPKTEHFSSVEPPKAVLEKNPERIQELITGFRERLAPHVSQNTIPMLRDRLPRTFEEKVLVRMGRSLWIPSTEEDWPQRDPFPEERIVTKGDLIKLEEEEGLAPYLVTSKLGNILFEKTRADIFSELFCPLIYFEYLVGYIHLVNTGDKRERISKDIVEQSHQFARILCWSLMQHGYFKSETNQERRFEAPILDLSASGILFAHPSTDLGKEILVHTDMDMTFRIGRRSFVVGTRIMRKFKDSQTTYFGAQFMRMTPEDFRLLFESLYGKPFTEEMGTLWEGGAPPPELVL